MLLLPERLPSALIKTLPKVIPKAPYAGYGKISKSTGKIKNKVTHGYFKPSNGYKFVNPYARSK
jgi:hypothetical protein